MASANSEPSGYEYSARDLLVEPNHYMYSKYGGEKFLQLYRKDREELWTILLQKISACTEKDVELLAALKGANAGSTTIAPKVAPVTILHQPKFSMQELLDALLASYSGPKKNKELEGIVEKIRRAFEAKRLLFAEYESGLKKGSGQTGTEPLYAAFSALLGMTMRSDKNLHVINALLKVNDCISSIVRVRSNLLTPYACGLALIGLTAEITQMRTLAGGKMP